MNAYYDIICSEIIHLTRADKIAILKIIKRNDSVKLHRYPDGTRVILNQVPDNVVKMIYEFMKHKLNLPDLTI